MERAAAYLVAFSIAAAGQGVSAAPFAFVTNQGDDSVSVIDLSSLRRTASIKVGSKPAGIAVSSNGRRIYVTNPESRDVYLLDGVEFKALTRKALGKGPLGIALSPDDTRVYVADWYEDRVYVL
ncbi:MAG: YncE family protein, partial [gamma proteobacterium symbiont of Ctena orbiculata]